MMEAYNELSSKGHIVLLPVFDCITMTKEQKRELHFKKIKMSDAIYVVNVNGYYGDDTKEEIEYAKSMHVSVLYQYYFEKSAKKS